MCPLQNVIDKQIPVDSSIQYYLEPDTKYAERIFTTTSNNVGKQLFTVKEPIKSCTLSFGQKKSHNTKNNDDFRSSFLLHLRVFFFKGS